VTEIDLFDQTQRERSGGSLFSHYNMKDAEVEQKHGSKKRRDEEKEKRDVL
jgi:hypothetical protein